MFVSNYNQDFITNKNVKLTVTLNTCLIKETKILSIRGSKTTEESQKFCVTLSLQGQPQCQVVMFRNYDFTFRHADSP